jgi:hypothetical protein
LIVIHSQSLLILWGISDREDLNFSVVSSTTRTAMYHPLDGPTTSFQNLIIATVGKHFCIVTHVLRVASSVLQITRIWVPLE